MLRLTAVLVLTILSVVESAGPPRRHAEMLRFNEACNQKMASCQYNLTQVAGASFLEFSRKLQQAGFTELCSSMKTALDCFDKTLKENDCRVPGIQQKYYQRLMSFRQMSHQVCETDAMAYQANLQCFYDAVGTDSVQKCVDYSNHANKCGADVIVNCLKSSVFLQSSCSQQARSLIESLVQLSDQLHPECRNKRLHRR